MVPLPVSVVPPPTEVSCPVLTTPLTTSVVPELEIEKLAGLVAALSTTCPPPETPRVQPRAGLTLPLTASDLPAAACKSRLRFEVMAPAQLTVPVLRIVGL